MEIIRIITLTLNITFGLYHVGLYFKTKESFDLFFATMNILAILLYLIH
jgi:hypothetical protein